MSLNLATLLRHSAREHPDRPALICGAEQLTYQAERTLSDLGDKVSARLEYTSEVEDLGISQVDAEQFGIGATRGKVYFPIRHPDGSVAGFQAVDDETDAGRPLGVRVAWSGGGAHFLAIIGYLEDVQNYVSVDDPIYGKSDVSYDTLRTSYQGSGTWTHSYYTKA